MENEGHLSRFQLSAVQKIMIVLCSLAAAVAVGWLAIIVRSHLPGAGSSDGMQAFGDLLFGLAVFGVLALLPLGLTLYWLRPVARFWAGLRLAALIYAATGPLALGVSAWLRPSVGALAIASNARIATMPLSALVLAACTLFAPSARLRWLLAGAAFLDCVIFTGVFVVKFVLPADR